MFSRGSKRPFGRRESGRTKVREMSWEREDGRTRGREMSWEREDEGARDVVGAGGREDENTPAADGNLAPSPLRSFAPSLFSLQAPLLLKEGSVVVKQQHWARGG